MPPAVFRWLVMMAALVLAVPLVAQRRPRPAASVDLVEIDVAVIDRHDNAVRDLEAADFRIKEDGELVEIKTFSKLAAGEDDSRDGRTIALLLDDTGISPLGTLSVQSIAKAFLTPARPADEVSVVRLHSRADEAYGDMLEAQQRIAGYRGGVRPFVPRESPGDMLRQVAVMSRQLGTGSSGRKAIVCIGAQGLCDVSQPLDGAGDLFDSWLAAVSAAATANVAVYAVVPGRVRLRGGGIVEATGGETYGSISDLGVPIRSVWQDSTLHYLLGYWPGQKSRRLHRIDVSVTRSHVTVRARRQRGEAPS
jgi:VWFA-related protein